MRMCNLFSGPACPTCTRQPGSSMLSSGVVTVFQIALMLALPKAHTLELISNCTCVQVGDTKQWDIMSDDMIVMSCSDQPYRHKQPRMHPTHVLKNQSRLPSTPPTVTVPPAFPSILQGQV